MMSAGHSAHTHTRTHPATNEIYRRGAATVDSLGVHRQSWKRETSQLILHRPCSWTRLAGPSDYLPKADIDGRLCQHHQVNARSSCFMSSAGHARVTSAVGSGTCNVCLSVYHHPSTWPFLFVAKPQPSSYSRNPSKRWTEKARLKLNFKHTTIEIISIFLSTACRPSILRTPWQGCAVSETLCHRSTRASPPLCVAGGKCWVLTCTEQSY
ncbi:hypothetical protein J3F83DRAFT_415499 [Trichoderma novae-zelandiae]